MVLKHPRWGLLPALVELLDLHGRAIHALPVSIYFETQFFPKICGARLLISDLFGCALFCVQQNLWSFSQISGAQLFKKGAKQKSASFNSCHPPPEKKRRVWEEVLRISDKKI